MPRSDRRSKSAPRPQRVDPRKVEDSGEAPFLQRHSAPRPQHGGRGRGDRAGGRRARGRVSGGFAPGFPSEEFGDPASMHRYRLFDSVCKYESDSIDDEMGPYHFMFGPRAGQSGASFPDLIGLHEGLIATWNLDFPPGEPRTKQSHDSAQHLN